VQDPFGDIDNMSSPDNISLSTGGSICLLAYWLFSSAVFDAHQPKPDIYIFPDHFKMLESFLGNDAQSQIASVPGTVEALISIGLWLDHDQRISATKEGQYMKYHHLLTLCAAFHPSLGVRNAATTFSGLILHGDPDEEDRLKILEDLLENCMFSALKACAVSWLREEIIAARVKNVSNIFSSAEALEQLQYLVFPDLQSVKAMEANEFSEYWVQNAPFLIQAANFAYFLFTSDTYQHVVPSGMAPAVEERYVAPLLQASLKLRASIASKKADEEEADHLDLDMDMGLDILTQRLQSMAMA